jgi:hypothetical protein
MFVGTPSTRNSASARPARVTASRNELDGEWAITFASSES